MPGFYLTINATGEPAEIEEVVDGGYYLRVHGHTRYLPADAVTHPAPEMGRTEEPRQ